MSEYISRDETYQRLHDVGGCGATEEWAKGYDDGITEAIRIINEMPAADVAPVVRCLDCQYFYPFFDPPYGKCSRRHCDDEIVKTTDFCSYAEPRKSNAEPLPEYDDRTVSGLLDD